MQFDSLLQELTWAGDRTEINDAIRRIRDHLQSLDLSEEIWSYIELGRAKKRGFAQRLSTAIAQKFADGLRPLLKHIVPAADGTRHEARALGAAGPKKLDVIHMTPEMGVGLAISIKTINSKDGKSNRYTKNVKRVDGELRAEASDYHERQPFAVFVALIFMPLDAASDGVSGLSSLRHSWDVFRARGGRGSPTGDHSRFEVVYLCLYDDVTGECTCFSVAEDMPVSGVPEVGLRLSNVLDDILKTFRSRNRK